MLLGKQMCTESAQIKDVKFYHLANQLWTILTAVDYCADNNFTV